MPTTFTRKILRLALVAAACGIALLVATGVALRRPDVQNWLIAHIWRPAGYQLRMQITGLDLSNGVGFRARNLMLTRPHSAPVTAQRLHVSFRLPALLKGRLIPDRLDMSGLQLEITGGRQLGLRPAEVFEKAWPYIRRLRRVHVQKAQVLFRERGVQLSNLELHLSRSAAAKPRLHLQATAVVKYRQRNVAIEISTQAGKRSGASAAFWIRGQLTARQVPFAWVPENRFFAFADTTADVRLRFSAATDNALTISAQTEGQRLNFVLTKGSARKAYHLRQPRLKFRLVRNGHEIELPDFSLDSERLHLAGNAAFGIQNGTVSRLSLTVQSTAMPMETVKAIFPSPILPAWYQTRLLPLFTAGRVRIDAFRLEGTWDQLAHLDHSSNRNHLALVLALKNIQAFKPVLPLAFEKASGRLILTNGNLKITGIDGIFGRSTIHAAAYRIPDLYARPALEIIDLRGRFALADFNKLRHSRLFSTGRNNALQAFEPLSGTMQGRLTLRVRHWSEAPDITAARLQLRDCRINWRPRNMALALNRAQLILSGTREWQYHGQGCWKNSRFDFSGTLDSSEAAGHVEIASQTDWRAVLTHFGNPLGLKADSRTLGNSRFQIRWKPDIWRMTADADLSGTGVRSPAFAIAAFKPGSRLSLDISSSAGHIIHIRRADLNSGTTSLSITGNFGTGANPSAHLELQTDYFSIQDLGLRLVSTRLPAGGIFSGRITIDMPLRDLSHAVVHGNLTGEEVTLPAGALPLPVGEASFKLIFSGRQVRIGLLRLPVNGHPVFIRGSINLKKPLKGALTLAADTLDLSRIVRHAPGGKTPAPSYLDGGELKLHITAARARLPGFSAGPLEAVCTYRDTGVTVDTATIRLSHGMIRTRGEYTPGSQPAWHLYAHVELTRQPIAQLFKQLGIPTDRFDGSATLLGVFSTHGNRWPELVSGLNGTFNLWVQNGIIRRSSVIIRVLDFLSLNNILDRRPDSVSGEGFYFEDLQNKSTITNGSLSLDYFKMKSPVFNALAGGSIDLPSGRLDIDLGAQPLGTIDTLISHIPIVGHILTGKNKTVMVYRFKIGGSLRHPEIKYQPFKHMGKSALAYFRRILLTPGRLWGRLADFKNDFVKRFKEPGVGPWQRENDPRYSHTIR